MARSKTKKPKKPKPKEPSGADKGVVEVAVEPAPPATTALPCNDNDDHMGSDDTQIVAQGDENRRVSTGNEDEDYDGDDGSEDDEVKVDNVWAMM